MVGHKLTVYDAAIGRVADRDVIVSSSRDGTIRVWNAVTGGPIYPPLIGTDGPIRAVVIGHAGDRTVIVSSSRAGTLSQFHPACDGFAMV